MKPDMGSHLKVQLTQFWGKRFENPDAHVMEFEFGCMKNGHTNNAINVWYFPCTLCNVSMEWYVQYKSCHLMQWARLRSFFLD